MIRVVIETLPVEDVDAIVQEEEDALLLETEMSDQIVAEGSMMSILFHLFYAHIVLVLIGGAHLLEVMIASALTLALTLVLHLLVVAVEIVLAQLQVPVIDCFTGSIRNFGLKICDCCSNLSCIMSLIFFCIGTMLIF